VPNTNNRARTALSWYLAAILVLTSVALAVVYIRGHVLGAAYPFDSLLYDPDVRFSDFTIFEVRFRAFLDRGDFFGSHGNAFAYPAPAALAYLPFYLVSDLAIVPFLMTMIAAACLAILGLWIHVRSNVELAGLTTRVLLVTAVTSYPFFFLIDRANIEGIIWILLALALTAFARDRNWLAAGLMGAAASMKPFPGILLLLLIARRKFKEFAFGVVVFAAINLVSMRLLSSSIFETWSRLSSGLNSFTTGWVFAYRPKEIGMDHSLFTILKQILHLKQKYPQLDHTMEMLHLPYLVLVFGSFGVGYLTYLRKLPILNQLFVFVVASTSFPFVSYDYTLIQLYIPWAAFLLCLTRDVASGRVNLSTAEALRFLIPCAIVFTPQSYLIVAKGISCGGQVKALALLAILHAAIFIPLPSSVFGDLERSKVPSAKKLAAA
jgi:Glycosyltransferase family 87